MIPPLPGLSLRNVTDSLSQAFANPEGMHDPCSDMNDEPTRPWTWKEICFKNMSSLTGEWYYPKFKPNEIDDGESSSDISSYLDETDEENTANKAGVDDSSWAQNIRNAPKAQNVFKILLRK